MARHLYIEKAKKLSFADNSIVICKNEDKVLMFPLEDLDLIFLEDSTTLISSYLLTEMANKGFCLVCCGSNYLPQCQSIPLNSHYEKSAHLKLQIELLPYKKKKLWETIVKAKIKNQISVISSTIDEDSCLSKLKNYYNNVKPGDEQNMEGVAAREYFSTLFGSDFIRFSKSPISIALNYGYSIIASAVIRQVACAGLEDNLGIWHDSIQNSNNLSYDLIEPFRQVVDYYIFINKDDITLPLSHNIKAGLISLLKQPVLINNKYCKLNYAIEITVNSFVEYLKNGDIKSILLPFYSPGYVLEEGKEE